MTITERIFIGLCVKSGLPEPVQEHVYIPNRKFRLDWAWADYKVGLEVQGGIFMRGKRGHSSIMGLKRDMEKNNLGLIAGWRVLQIIPQALLAQSTISMVRDLIMTTKYAKNDIIPAKIGGYRHGTT